MFILYAHTTLSNRKKRIGEFDTLDEALGKSMKLSNHPKVYNIEIIEKMNEKELLNYNKLITDHFKDNRNDLNEIIKGIYLLGYYRGKESNIKK